MRLSRLITYSFAPNVGQIDRVFRVASGSLIAMMPWFPGADMPVIPTIALTIFGVAWLSTGVVSRCGMYYLLGLSTKQV